MINLLAAPPAEPEELTRWRTLAVAVIENALVDLRNPKHVVAAASWLLEVDRTIWAEWVAVPRHLVRARVAEAAAAMITTGRLYPLTRPASPRTRAHLADVLRRHGLPVPVGPVVAPAAR